MDILKTPQQKLLEQMGVTPASPGYVKTPQQLLFEEANVMPGMYADGGSVNAQDLLAELLARGYQPQRFVDGGPVANLNRTLGTSYTPVYNPEATMEPQDRSSYTLRTRDKIAEILARLSNNERFAEQTADELFGTGSGGMEPWVGQNIPSNIVKGAVQTFNPLSAATYAMDAPKEALELTREGHPIQGGLQLSLAALGVLPYVGPALRKLKKTKK